MSGDRRPWFAAAFLLLVTVLVVSRLVALGAKLPHHDEMVHQWLSEQLAFTGHYRASPAFHGPLLYHLQAGVMRIAGADLWQARLVPALASLAAVLALVALAARESGPRAALAVAALATLSPLWLYYARFDGHDPLILLATAGVAWGRQQWQAGRIGAATWLIVGALGLAWCTKLNALFLAGAIGLWPVVRRVALGAWPPRPRIVPLVTAGLTVGLVAAALFVTTYVAIRAEASGASALVETLRAATVDPVAYWAGLHGEQRLPGPFHYYVALIALYDPLLVAAAALALVAAWRMRPPSRRTVVGALAIGLVLCAALWPVADAVEARLHLHPLHFVVLPLALLALAVHARQRADVGDEAGVWWTWMAATQTLLYAYAGEKVPWLAVHVILPWIMVGAPALARGWETGGAVLRSTLVACALLTGWSAWAVAVWTAGDPAEPLVQLEYAPDLHATLAGVRTVCTAAEVRMPTCLETTTDAAWPAQWYLRGADGAPVGTAGLEATPSTPFVLVPARRTSPEARTADFGATHVPYPVRFSFWGTWTEWLRRPRPDALLAFWLRRHSLGPRRGVAYELWVRQDLVGAWTHADTASPPDSAKDDRP